MNPLNEASRSQFSASDVPTVELGEAPGKQDRGKGDASPEGEHDRLFASPILDLELNSLLLAPRMLTQIVITHRIYGP